MLTGDAAAAEDLLQSALAKTWPHWRRIAGGNPDAYVRKVMVRTNAGWRSRLWINERPTDDVAGAHGSVAGSWVDEHQSTDERITLTSALAALPLRQRQAIVLRYYEDLSVETVADVMGTSTGTVKSQCAKGLSKLRTSLGAVDLEWEQR